MRLSLPFFKKKSQQSAYLGLYLTDASAFGFVFENSDGVPYLISQNTFSLTAGFDKILEDIDNLISDLELKTKLRLDKTIFFLHSWMIDEATYEIKEPYKSIIKDLCKNLELEPLGYIDVKEALEKYFHAQSIVNTIAVEVNKTKLGITIFKGNKVVHSQYTARTEEVGDDLNSVFQELPKHIVLPTNIKVYGDEDKAEVSSQLATFAWEEKIFSQHPTIEVIKQVELNQTLAESFTAEMSDKKKEAETNDLEVKPSDSEGKPPKPEIKPNPADSGFIVGRDVLSDPELQSHRPVISSEQNQRTTDSIIVKIKQMAGSIPSLFKMPQVKGNKKLYITSAVILIFVLGSLFLYEYFLHTLRIKIYLQSKSVDQTYDIELPIKETETEEPAVIKKTAVKDYSSKKETTGVREVGEKATGKVTIHNFDNSERTFTKGTQIAKGALVYVLDTEVKVASSSGVTSDGVKKSGKGTVEVTAQEIGPQYNLDGGTQLTIASLSQSLFLAIADGGISGGTKKEIKTVSKEDITALETEAKKESEKNVKNILGEQISKDEVVIPDLTDVELADTQLSGEVGEEASTLTFKAKSEINYFVVKHEALLSKLKELIGEELEDGYQIEQDNIEYKIDDIDEGKNKVNLTLATKGQAHKNVDLGEVKGAVNMKMTSSLEEFLKSKYAVTKVELEKSTFGSLPIVSSWTPVFSKNIEITTSVR